MNFVLFSYTLLSFSMNIYCSTIRSTQYGQVKGKLESNQDGVNYYSFRSIPFAKPPVGDLRFRSPEEPDSWNDTLDATNDPPVCMQRNYMGSTSAAIEGQEDCLYINVYVPEVEEQLPVMVFIHGGGFSAGASTSGFYGPKYFMNQSKVVLVTFNYRLGPFGFLSTGDDESPGNYALKDQVLALKWVQNNIQNFNGAANNVTIFGQSAGATSVHYHIISPASRGLFHKAITESGTAVAFWSLPTNARQQQYTVTQAENTGCGDAISSSASLIACLRNASGEAILTAQDALKGANGNPLVVYGPVSETKTERNPNPFITSSPIELLLNGEFASVPWLTGVVQNEGDLRIPYMVRSSNVREDLNTHFQQAISEDLFVFQVSTNDTDSLYHQMVNFYLGGEEYVDVENANNVQGLLNAFGDRMFIYPAYNSLQLHVSQGHNPIYVYSFEYKGQYTYGDLFAGTNETIDFEWGVCHCDELIYLFDSPNIFPNLDNDNDKLVRDKLIDMWTNFAYSGNPNPLASSTWNPLNVSSSNIHELAAELIFLNITGNYSTGSDFQMEKGFYVDRVQFWSDTDINENDWKLPA